MPGSPDQIFKELEKLGIPKEVVMQELGKRGVDTSALIPKQSMGQTVLDATKQAVGQSPLGMVAQGVQAIGNPILDAPPVVQKALATGAGAEVGMMGGPLMAGVGAATAGAATEALQNPQKTAEVVAPILKQAVMPTPENIASTTQMLDANQSQAADFAKRRGIEFGTGAAVAGAIKGVKAIVGPAEGPASATFENPSLVFKGVRGKIMQELGTSKTAAMAGEDVAEASRLRRLLLVPAGQRKLAEEALTVVQNGEKISNTQALAYEEALGKVQTKGGTFADVYAKARKSIRAILSEQAPTVAKYKSLARKVFLAQGEGESTTSLIEAIRNPVSAASKFAGTGRMVGAGLRVGLESLLPAGTSMAAALEDLAKNRRR